MLGTTVSCTGRVKRIPGWRRNSRVLQRLSAADGKLDGRGRARHQQHRMGGSRLTRPEAHVLALRLRLDVRLLESLADKAPTITGMKLSRFDRVLGLNRERIDKIYRGFTSTTTYTEP